MKRTPLVETWLEALESGKYPQSTEYLRDKQGYCCLGVLCDVLNPLGWEEEEGLYHFNYIDAKYIYQLPPTLKSDLGMSNEDMFTLIDLNDTGKPFSLIAKHIREMIIEDEENTTYR